MVTLEARDPLQNGVFKGLKCREVGHKLEDYDKAFKNSSEPLFIEEEMVQYCDENVKQYWNNFPISDKPASDENDGSSEEDEALALMVLTTYFTHKQDSEEVYVEDGEERPWICHVLSLFTKM